MATTPDNSSAASSLPTPASVPAAPLSSEAGVPAAGAPPAASVAPAASSSPAADAAPAPSPLAAADASKHERAVAKPADSKPSASEAPAAPVVGDGAPKPPESEKPADTPAEAKVPEPAKPADVPEPSGDKKPEGDKPADAAAVKPPAPPVYDAYKFPESFKPDDKQLETFNGILAKAELAGKADHAAMQSLGQELVDFHAAEMARVARDVTQNQVDVWNRMKEGLINRLKTDPEIGGNRIETSLGNAKYAYENYLGLNADQQQELMTFLDNSGASSHPLLIRAFNNLYQRFGEPEPVQPALPTLPTKGREPGGRGWYASVDGVNAA